jgi:hypothetical protein
LNISWLEINYGTLNNGGLLNNKDIFGYKFKRKSHFQKIRDILNFGDAKYWNISESMESHTIRGKFQLSVIFQKFQMSLTITFTLTYFFYF